ncbi:hypothetical protein GCM10022381_32860 [Leifsonia kafniensis]|uniref:Uncharacterized protein n=1 Tax=Leifsonia kafniensis TaxID=475957 RepID=A0ABP7KUZ4_9MICO
MLRTMKSWSFNTCAIAGFSCSSFAVLLIIVNALTGSVAVTQIIPVAVLSLVIGGALSVRAHVLWMHGNNASSTSKPKR